jgi:NADH:ubiquinone reductase (H+-translocating)
VLRLLLESAAQSILCARCEPVAITKEKPVAGNATPAAARDRRYPGVHKTWRGAGRPPHVVIVGAGFGGLAAAQRLGRAPVEVSVIDRRNHHLFQPLLYQVATAALSPADIAAPIRATLRPYRNTEVLLDEVIGVDREARRVLTRDNAGQSYDYLILSTGSAYAYFGHEDWPRLAPGLKSLEDATAIRRQLLLAFERAETTRDPAVRERLLTFVLIGGGPTGVELAGAIAELAKATLARDFRHIDPKSARIVLVEAGPRLLPAFPEKLGAYATSALERMGVEVRLRTAIEQIDEAGVVGRGERIPAATVIWSAGVRPAPVGEWLGTRTARNGAVEVAPDLSVPEAPEIFVLGDAARALDPEGRPLPGLAAVAQQQGQYVGELIAARVEGRPDPGPFVYRDRGTMATIGRSAAVADFGTVQLTGHLAWLLWGLVHIYLLIGFRNRLAVFVNWMWSWLTYGRGARLITGPITPDGGCAVDGAIEPAKTAAAGAGAKPPA